MNNQEKNLRNLLKVNAAFSLMSGSLLIIFSNDLAEIMELKNSTVLVYIGVGLLLFVMILLLAALRKQINTKEVKGVIVQDWTWVVGSIVLLLFNPFNISLAGNLLIGVVALIVGILAWLQQSALSKLNAD